MDDNLGTGGENKTPLYISIAALALALLALLFAFNARSKATQAETSVTGLDKTFVTKTAYEAGFSGLAKQSDVQLVSQEFGDFKGQVVTQFTRIGEVITEQNRVITSLSSRGTTAARPTNGGTTATAPTAGPGEYIIKSGDTFAKIARAQGVNLADLTKANPSVNPSKLKVGQKIAIPAKK